MQLKEIMTPSPAAIGAQNSIRDAAKKMQALDVGFLPISENNEVIGVLTDRDITLRAVAENRDLEQTKVREIMTPSADILDEDSSVEECAHLMKEHQIRRVLVKRHEGDGLCGVVSLGDLAVHTGDRGLYAECLEEVSQPATPHR